MHFINDVLVFLFYLLKIIKGPMISQNILRINLLRRQQLRLPLRMHMRFNKCLRRWRTISLMKELLLSKVIIVLVIKVIIMWYSWALATLLFENSVDCTEFNVIFSWILFFYAKCFRVNCLIDKPGFRITDFLFYASIANMWVLKATNSLSLLINAWVICII